MADLSDDSSLLYVGLDLGQTHARLVYLVGKEPEDWRSVDHYGQPYYPAIMCNERSSGAWLAGHQAEIAVLQCEEVEAYVGLKQALTQDKPDPQQLQAARKLLLRLSNDAVESSRARIRRSAFAVPLSLSSQQRDSLRTVIGTTDLRIISEPEAALLGYQLDATLTGSENIVMVLNSGGGGGWCAVLRLRRYHDLSAVDVLAYEERPELGGDAFDASLRRSLNGGRGDALLEEIAALNASERPRAESELGLRVRQLKQSLSGDNKAQSSLPEAATSLMCLDGRAVTLSQRHLIDNAELYVLQVQTLASETLKNAGVRSTDVKQTLAIGGMTRVNTIRTYLSSLSVPNAVSAPRRAHPDMDLLCVAVGAARFAAAADAADGEARFTALESPAFGVLLDTGIFDVVIPANSAPPVTRKKVYSASLPGESQVEFALYYGFSRSLSGNNYLGTFTYRFATTGTPDDFHRDRCRLHLTMKLDSVRQLSVIVEDYGTEDAAQPRGVSAQTFVEQQPGHWVERG